MGAQKQASGADFAAGVFLGEIADGATLAGRVDDTPVLVSRRGDRFHAVAGVCTHYGAPLGQGHVAGDRVRCPWHHACFDLKTGEAVAAPAFAPLQQWRVEVRDDRVFVREAVEQARPQRGSNRHPGRIVIVGGGAAGFAAADMLRRRGFGGSLIVLSSDDAAPYDRPNLSKDYLAGTAPEEWIPLKDEAFYREREIDLRLNAPVARLDPAAHEVTTRAGETLRYDALLLATGATPVRLGGFDRPNVHVLRTLADSRALIAGASGASSAAIIGAGFIGLETAAALRARGLEVAIIAPDAVPLARVLGSELGHFVQQLHEAKGVRFHLGATANSFDGARVELSNGRNVAADLVILGVGVRPNIELAQDAGLAVDKGVVTDAQLRTNAPDIFAAGDIARYPDLRTGQLIRIEHWVAAQRQGQTAALNMLGEATPHVDAPFFWSNHYDANIRYVGHAHEWDELRIDGSIEARDFTARYLQNGRLLAAASIGRDCENAALHEELNSDAQKAA